MESTPTRNAAGPREPAQYSRQGTPAFDNQKALAHSRAIIELIFGPRGTRSFAVSYWTGDEEPAAREPAPFTIAIRRAGGLRRMLLPPNELSIVEAVLSGDIDIEGDMEAAMSLGDAINQRLKSVGTLFSLARHLLALPRDEPGSDIRERRAELTVEKVGASHEPKRDRAAVRYHYDVGNDFYALWLDERMVYSCAYFDSNTDVEANLDAAQVAKLDLICRKLRLAPGERLLDVGCGWGGLIMHAAEHYGVSALGVTLSDAQAALARERIAARGLSDRCRVEIRDYRALGSEGHFDKISSVGMVEHVGMAKLPAYFGALHAVLAPGGLFLNHGIVSMAAARPASRWDWLEHRVWKRDAFIEQYVFPDGRLGPLQAVIGAAEAHGFFSIDMESLREHYALTLRAWLARLARRADEAIALTDERIYRTWRLYMAGSAHGFASGSLNVVQTLFGKPTEAGVTVPLRRGYMNP
ncbi:MAG: class I SAM-dependent methyltransferase [bacterium]